MHYNSNSGMVIPDMISIVIPALNEERLLPDCLRSLKNQDYDGDCEIIVVDNGSTDATADIAHNFGARVIPANEKKDVFYARQVGADAAHGDIIVQADADTIYPRDWLKRIADRFASHPKVIAVTGRFVYRDKFIWSKIEYFLRNLTNSATAALFGRPLMVSGATFAFRRSAFLSANGYHGLFYSADQYGIAGRLSRLGKVLYDKDLYCLTSPRSVRKPTHVLIRDVLANINHLGVYFSKGRLNTLQELITKIPIKQLAIRILPVPVLLFSFIAYGYFIPASPVFGKVYYKGSPAENVVALTFDDGPNEPYTSQVLDILASYNIKGTFFVIGKNVELYPDTARRIIAEGHVVGNHSYSHNANHALTEYGVKDLRLAQEVIVNITSVSPHLYRPPHGKKSPWELQAVKKEGLIEVTWSVSANDQHALVFLGEPSPETFAREIVKGTHPGEIILLHDGYGTLHNTAKSDKTLTVESLPLIIEQLQAKGYQFVTVPQLLNKPAYNEVLP
jgi:peptidoglycan/xylan/chitin deacetylase (PgdA/CDA1 family)